MKRICKRVNRLNNCITLVKKLREKEVNGGEEEGGLYGEMIPCCLPSAWRTSSTGET